MIRPLLLSLLVLLATPTLARADLLDPARVDLEAARLAANDADSAPFAQAIPVLLRAGAHDRALERTLARLDDGTPLTLEERLVAVDVALATRTLDGVPELTRSLLAEAPDSAPVRMAAYRWRLARADLAGIDAAIEARVASPTVAETLFRAELALTRRDLGEARAGFAKALDGEPTAAVIAMARAGLARVHYKARDYDAAIAELERALGEVGCDSLLLVEAGLTLIRLGRTDEAIDAFELAVKTSPYSERAHYLLGNGYARKNYSQLYEAYPEALAGAGEDQIEMADALFAAGDYEAAEGVYQAMGAQQPGWAEIPARLGSLAFMRGDYGAARDYFKASLALCPEYGRAHNGLAKALEAQRMAVEIHRAADRARFDASAMPDVPGIETFVVNWDALSDRHRKQVALALAPWERYIPVLVEAEATYYIKPLHELLSETPGQELLRDQRINYDSRLWDDVRGCGGYHTVTGVEDVERSIYNRYNTVLHELTHQVHGVQTPDRSRAIQELYRRTKERDEADPDTEAFLSRYAGGSVWEYFAEGANALFSPRRDDYDYREIVTSRLTEMDPALIRLVEELMVEADVESCYVVGYVNRGDEYLQQGKVERAVGSYNAALRRDPASETGLASLRYAMLLKPPTDPSKREVWGNQQVSFAERDAKTHVESASLALAVSNAHRHAGHGLAAARASLEHAREGVREPERNRLDAELGRLAWLAGDAPAAREAYQRVLDYQADSPTGLWGLAQAHALAGDWDAAWGRYEEAVRMRTGVVDLRCDYAFDLLRAGDVERAAEQVDAALLLDAGDPRVLALAAWVALEREDVGAASALVEDAIAAGEWCDLAYIVKGMTEARHGSVFRVRRILDPVLLRMESDLPPEYVYRDKWGRFDEVHLRPELERLLIVELLQ